MGRLAKHGIVESVIAASIVAALVLFFVFGAASGFTGANLAVWAGYYGNLLEGSLASFLYWTILFVYLVPIILVIWSLGGAFLEIIFPKWKAWRRGADGSHLRMFCRTTVELHGHRRLPIWELFIFLK